MRQSNVRKRTMGIDRALVQDTASPTGRATTGWPARRHPPSLPDDVFQTGFQIPSLKFSSFDFVPSPFLKFASLSNHIINPPFSSPRQSILSDKKTRNSYPFLSGHGRGRRRRPYSPYASTPRSPAPVDAPQPISTITAWTVTSSHCFA